MNRREFIRAAAGVMLPTPLSVPVHRVMNTRARCTPEELRRFWWEIWPEAAREFSRGGLRLEATDGKGEIRLSAGDRPLFTGVERGVLNLVLTDYIPMYWDNGRALAGVTTIREGYHLCVIALKYAHGNRIPFLSVNTCVHELLHALMQDIFVSQPKWFQTDGRELRNDWYATRLWLFHDASAIRTSAQAYLRRLRPS